jgi:hypothetical protein
MSVEVPSSIVAGLSFIGRSGGAVKTLAGFQKGRHSVPTAVNAATSAFLARLCEPELTTQAEAFFQQVRSGLGYKRRELSLSVTSPGAVLTGREFTLEIAYALEEAEPSRYHLVHTLRELRRAELARQAEFNAIFAGLFSELSFALRKGVLVEAVIDLVESLDAACGIVVTFPSDCRKCTLTMPGVEAEVRCTQTTVDLVFAQRRSPAELLAAFAAVRAAFAIKPELAALLG